ncbi:hypothetical protein BKA04_000963 [Cryobacterium mesophilum]|uniref:hypothetical protein n=1 Tax=Terrimesophilobacter mesophilus TaxID=433647 RepID=UPI0014258075|nr:hypothetical protein [Terrimesophilobacter mesophilus]MBB5632740.1 hypothetical protein [Terrimesophilobacter mesophilus]
MPGPAGRVHNGVMDGEEFTSTGDPVCWLEHVCDECGALIDGALPATCWRCGAAVVAA